MKSTIKVSFIIIAYNEESNISRCIESILNQNHLDDYEIIVVNDGSKDSTAKVVTQYSSSNKKIKLLSLPTNQGRGAARQAGVNVSLGKYIAFVDADIILPQHWLTTCMNFMNRYDAVGGLAIPDGDVNYLYVKFNLIPKKVHHSTTITGCNGLYSRRVFESVSFDKKFRDGEDFVFNNHLRDKKFKLHSISSLIVDHRESKSFFVSMKWLFQSGVGSSRLLKQFGKLRLPDITFFGLLATLVSSLVLSLVLHIYYLLLLIFAYIALTSVLHLYTKFYFKPGSIIQFLAAIFVNSILLTAYYIGRTVGFFTTKSMKQFAEKKVMICFDYEAQWGMPFKAKYDLENTTNRLLKVLDKYNAKAVFYVVGEIIEKFPDVVKQLSDKGHEIGIHGYSHENLDNIDKKDLEFFKMNIIKIRKNLKTITGKEPRHFRSPFLMAPSFYSTKIYQILKEHNYKSVSNRELRFTEELFRPDRINISYFWGKNNFLTKFLFLFLNLSLILNERKKSNIFLTTLSNINWLNKGAEPFFRKGLLEIPLYSPLDCDLLGLPNPIVDTPEKWIDYSVKCLVGGLKRPGSVYSLNLHEWITGSANRIKILEDTLKYMSSQPYIEFVTNLNNQEK